MRKLVVIAGPTAVGKSKTAVLLAKRLQGEIISADSMQVYRHMDIGTAKITPSEMQGVRHFLIDILDPFEEFNVARFQELSRAAMEEIYERGGLPIIAGGTGFYIQSVAYGIEFAQTADSNGDILTSSYRQKLEELAKTEGPHVLHEILREKDPKSAELIHENNVKRVIRALEFYEETGETISAHNALQREKTSPYDLRYYVLTMPRELLYRRIDERVDQMLEQGFLEEVKKLAGMGLTRENLSMQGLGYKQLYSFLEGEISYDEAVRLIKRDTRHFAKRQLTWFKRERDVRWIDLQEFANDPERVVGFLAEDIEK